MPPSNPISTTEWRGGEREARLLPAVSEFPLLDRLRLRTEIIEAELRRVVAEERVIGGLLAVRVADVEGVVVVDDEVDQAYAKWQAHTSQGIVEAQAFNASLKKLQKLGAAVVEYGRAPAEEQSRRRALQPRHVPWPAPAGCQARASLGRLTVSANAHSTNVQSTTSNHESAMLVRFGAVIQT